ncbi:MAG: hypothetical protein LWX09_01245 [Bacteroidia bacterium]|jgi:uncharacterized protein YqgV (UPF0045/DUF77 family)|nr:hypothetical protein [Bacteroidia bacterium]
MNISVEISYYPLHEEFIPPIKNFIERMNEHKNITCATNGMSTQVFGSYEAVMSALTTEIRRSFELPHSVFVLKIINKDLNIKDGSL